MNSEGENGRMRTQARPVDRRSEILRHACALFARQGYGGTTVRQIAEAAQLLSGSLYHHFPSKEAMLLDILEEYFAETVVRNRTALDGAEDAVAALRGLIRASLTVIAHNPDAAVVVVGECRRLALSDERFRWLAERTAQNNTVWHTVIAEGVRTGLLRSDLETETIGYFVQTSVWAMAQWYRTHGRYDPDEASGLLVELFVRGIAEPHAYRRGDLRGILRDAAPVQWPAGASAALGNAAGRPARSADGADPRARIGQAAGLLFARQGYAVTTTRQIAELAGVPVGSLAHHIGSKERLLGDMLAGFFEELLAAFGRDEAVGRGPSLRMAGLVARTVEGLAEHGVASVLLLNEATADDVPKAEISRLLGDVEGVWTRVLADGMRDGDFRAGLDAAFVQRVARTALSTSSVAYPGMEVRHLTALYQEVLLGGIGARPE
ncbi:TetR/AcrR family transcriptional regulator [Yinghuangia sp. ASG 101]|uniref:TetR/AcrR family transcriptional regulator n=1 Tax=Yinghuangia sp. ASG 101 TaxID=2896848 RepID=UPI001E2D76B3|nr:TetR/AcrR family transcriptional regulator [Yinghuangia sp. ASG 101]UGQ09389.1 TetR/AcrR family transcriptional regulator [Yinghuangia sp. ASG 101]